MTEQRRQVVVVRPAPVGQRLVHADDLDLGGGSPNQWQAARRMLDWRGIAHAHVAGRDHVQGQRVGRGIEPVRALGDAGSP